MPPTNNHDLLAGPMLPPSRITRVIPENRKITVRMDGTLVRLFGWTKAAGHKAIMRLFARFDMLSNERVQAEAYRWFFGKISALKQVTLDVNSTVITRNGEQEGAACSYNPNRHGRASHHPLLALSPRRGWWPISGCGREMRTVPTTSCNFSNRPCIIWATRSSACSRRQWLLRRGHPGHPGRQAASLHHRRPADTHDLSGQLRVIEVGPLARTGSRN